MHTAASIFSWLRRLIEPSPSYLSATCSSSANWTVDPLSGDPRATYNPPSGQLINQCQCTTVLYSLLQACSTCQGCSTLSWSAWSSPCPSNYIGKTYPYAIPSGTQIPGWAYLDVTASGNGSGWNETAAEQYARQYHEIFLAFGFQLNLGFPQFPAPHHLSHHHKKVTPGRISGSSSVWWSASLGARSSLYFFGCGGAPIVALVANANCRCTLWTLTDNG